jgi:hypothetical protein
MHQLPLPSSQPTANLHFMKSAYELAMERLESNAPSIHLTDEQKDRIAAVEAKCKADIAAKELLLQGEIAKASASGSGNDVEQLRRQLADEIRRFEEKRDREKEAIREGK